jgi:hypothetical protein
MNVEEIFNHTLYVRILVLVVSSVQFGHIHKSCLQCLTHEPKNNVTQMRKNKHYNHHYNEREIAPNIRG